MTDLAPCPFCGSAAHTEAFSDGEVAINCRDQKCAVKPWATGTLSKATAAWNRRAQPSGEAGDAAMRQILTAINLKLFHAKWHGVHDYCDVRFSHDEQGAIVSAIAGRRVGTEGDAKFCGGGDGGSAI